VRGFKDFDAPARNLVAVAGDHDAGKRPRPVRFEDPRHFRRSLAGADHHQTPARRFGQETRQAARWPRGFDRRVGQAAQELAWMRHGTHVSCLFPSFLVV
jgi:hypothetical protein